jgi:hypothetical protein
MIKTIIAWLIKIVATASAKKIAIAVAEELAKRTDNTIDDKAVQIVKEALQEE